MEKLESGPDHAGELRRRAENHSRASPTQSPRTPDLLSPENTTRLLHELEVHQIELELQNQQLREAQAELETARERYFDLYDLAPVGYCTLGETGLILEANLTAANLLGVVRGEMVQQPIARFIRQEDQGIYHRHLEQLFNTGEPQACEVRMVTRDGRAFWGGLQAAAAPTATGQRLCRLVLSDITERKRAEENRVLEAQNRRVEKAESLGRMAGAIAHHFNNQLQTVLMSLRLAMKDLPEHARTVDTLSGALQSVRKAAELSGLMLTYLGQESGHCVPLDLSEICRRHLPMLQSMMPKRVVLDVDFPCPGPTISADASQIRHILTNLVTNAWEAIGDAQGAIHLSVKLAAAANISATNRFPVDRRPHGHPYVCLEVADTGCGIKDEDVERLFDPFFTRKFIGRGLGLAVVLGIVRAHDGIVTVATEPGGSVFRVFFPALAPLVSRPPDQIAPALEFRGGGSMLLVEDEPNLRAVLAGALTGLGFSVLAAMDGVEAVELFRGHQQKIRFVLCDLTMPRMNGWEILTALRQLAPGLPVILSSGYNEARVMAGDHSEQPQAFLGKPYEHEELVNAISLALAQA